MLNTLINTHELICDEPDCYQSVLGETGTHCLADARSIGWSVDSGSHTCPECTAGNTPSLDLKPASGGPGTAKTITPVDVEQGQEVIDTVGEVIGRGEIIGYATHRAVAGQPVIVKIGPDVTARLAGRTPTAAAVTVAQRGRLPDVIVSPEDAAATEAKLAVEARQSRLAQESAVRGSVADQAALSRTMEDADPDVLFGSAGDDWDDDGI